MRIGAGCALAAGLVGLLTDGASPWTELAFGIAIPAVIAVNLIALFKMEEDF